jgi:hypothetical protein
MRFIERLSLEPTLANASEEVDLARKASSEDDNLVNWSGQLLE